MKLHPVVIVGAGPGSADLITVRGARRLADAQVVLFDALTDARLRELAPTAQWLDVGKRGFAGSTGQAHINALLVKHARLGLRVVRLKGGDPSVFGRLEEELQALADAGLEAEVVPGVTAALAAAAVTRKPLTRRGDGRSVSFATAMTGLPTDGSAVPAAAPAPIRAGAADTAVFYMAGRQLASLSRRLREAGWPDGTPASVVSRAGWPDALASAHTVADLAQAGVLHAGRPTVVTVGVGARALPLPARAGGASKIPLALAAQAPTAPPLAQPPRPLSEDTPEDPS